MSDLLERVRQKAEGQWPAILAHFGIPAEFLVVSKTKEGPCPNCGGNTRYRFDDRHGNGDWFCSHCGGKDGRGGGGTGFDLLMRIHHWTFPEALRAVAQHLGVEDTWRSPTTFNPGRCDGFWQYTDEFVVVRRNRDTFNSKGKREKDVFPWRWNGQLWECKPPDGPLPLYNRDELRRRPDAPVLVVEGEKAADAAALLFPEQVVITWHGGTKRVAKTDWAPLQGRQVTLWPDADADGGGIRAMEKVAAIAPAAAFWLVTPPEDVADGWDLADALAEGWTPEKVLHWLDTHRERQAAPDQQADHAVGEQAEELRQIHQTLRQMVDDGAGDAEIQAFINEQGSNGYGLRQFVDAVRQELQAAEDARESVARLPDKGDTFEPTVAAYLPDQFQGLTRVLREGIGYPEPAIVTTILVAVTALLRPDIRVRALSFEQPCILWLFLVAGSGVGKTPLLKHLVLDPIRRGVLSNLQESNRQRLEEWQRQTAAAQKEKKEPPPKPRRRNCIVTSTTTQGLRADMAVNGADSPMFLIRDELSSWLKEMASAKDTTADVGFFLSAYDGAYSNDVLADENRCREVKQGKLSVIGGIQPAVFEEYLPKGIENGFNTRPLFVHMPRVRKRMHNGEWDPLVSTLARLYEAAFDGRGLAPGAVYTPTPKAEAAFVEFFDDNETRGLEASSPAVDAIWQKANGQVLRVAAGLQFLRDHYQMDDPEPPSGDPLRPRISFDTMTLAIQLVIAGKVTGVAIHERATNPQAALAARFMEKARDLQPGQSIHLGEFAKRCWEAKKRPKRPQLLELARGLHLAGQIQLSPDEKQFSLATGSVYG